MSMKKSPYLRIALKAVKKAEEVILSYYNKKINVDVKRNNSPVTIVDKKAEQIIIDTIREAFPDHNFLGEEHGAISAKSDYTWIIDPIDETKNFIRSIPFFSTELALVKNDKFIIGVSNAPLIKELLYAEKNLGAWMDKKQLRVSKINNINEAYILSGGIKYFSRKGLLPQLVELSERARGYRFYPSFWSYHLLAQGKVDGMIEIDTYLYDVAAAITIVQEAGGRITDLEGKPINADTRKDVTIVASNGKIHQQILDAFNE